MRNLWLRRVVRCMAVCALFACLPPAAARAAAPRMHALLVSCDNFLSLPSLAPSPSNNVNTLTEVLSQMNDSPLSLRTEINSIGTKEELSAAIKTAYASAQPGDICLFYISTHGRFSPMAPEYPAELTLSDGENETDLSGAELEALLADVPGVKLVLVDACNSGALMGKGVTPNLNDQPVLPFHRPDFKVLTSAGGNELSWNWSSAEEYRFLSQGSSFFAKTLANGLGLGGRYDADLNRDGEITLKEIYTYLLGNHGSSTTHVYPQDDESVLFRYDPRAKRPQAADRLLSSISFTSDTLSQEDPAIEFSFTVHQPVRLQYQLVFSKGGAWDWDNATLQLDTYEPDASDSSDGTVQPGRKQRTIEIGDIDADTSGYVLMQIMTLTDNGPDVFFSKLLTVIPAEGDPKLRVDAFGEQFSLAEGDELALQVVHEFPVRLTVGVYDVYGNPVRRLATDQASRPMRLLPEGSLFYWDGCDAQGKRVPPGLYTLRASTRVAGTLCEASTEIELLN